VNANELQLWNDLRAGQTRVLAKVITLIENQRPDQRVLAEKLLSRILPAAGKSIRIGITGAPGVGKSTFIEQFGLRVVQEGHRLAVLAIDPTSPLSGGSILGDRIRMEELSRHPNAFIRPSPSGLSLGGVARYTRETILACEAAGFDRIIVETVGVGQSEVEVASMVDVFLILQQPYSGDDIQGLKKGLLELADLVAVTKGDGELLLPAQITRQKLESSLHLAKAVGNHGSASWDHDHLQRVLVVSGKTGDGLDQLLTQLDQFVGAQECSGGLQARRIDQAKAWFQSELNHNLEKRFFTDPWVQEELKAIEPRIHGLQATPSLAAKDLVSRFLQLGPRDV
jgi:LAO/AO transport system kinase